MSEAWALVIGLFDGQSLGLKAKGCVTSAQRGTKLGGTVRMEAYKLIDLDLNCSIPSP